MFESKQSGVVKCYVSSASEDFVSFSILHPETLSSELPSEQLSSELSHQRQVYLYSKIRPFCPDYAKDILCPIQDATDNSEFEPAVPEPVEATAAATGSTTKGSELSDQTELAPVTRK